MGEKICTKRASKVTGLSVATLETMRCRKPEHAPPYLKIGKRVMYDLDELEAWLRNFHRCR